MPGRDGLRPLRRGGQATGPAPPGERPAAGERPAGGRPAAERRPAGGARDGVSRADVEAVLAEPEQIRMDFQPILDVRYARTAGWEVLARFDGRCSQGPDHWFAAAYRHGLGIALEAATLRRALSALRMRTPGTFMSVNVSPAALDDAHVVELIAASAPLTGLVIELTEHMTPPDPGPGPWAAACRRLRELGATIAIDDIGKGYAEMLQILQLHPQIIKIDKAIVGMVDKDPAHRAMLRFLGLFADEIDAWLLAEGVETRAQLSALQALGVPLAQGWLVGLPDAVPRPCPVEVTTSRGEAPPVQRSPASTRSPALTTVGEVMRPVTGGPAVWWPSGLRVQADLPLAEAARRALTRPPEQRYDPLQCLGPGGDVRGELAVHDLFLAIVERGTPPVG